MIGSGSGEQTERARQQIRERLGTQSAQLLLAQGSPPDIVVFAICAIFAGADGWVAVGAFGRRKKNGYAPF